MGDLTQGKRKVPESLGNARPRDSSDEELLERLRAGDEAGVEEVVSRYAGPAYRVALRLTGKPEDAEEVTWEVMETVARKISSFRGDSSLSTWVYRIATNAAYGKLRARQPALSLEENFYNPGEAEALRGNHQDWSGLCEDPAAQLELRAVVERAIGTLPPNDRAALILHDMEGLSNAEVADILGLSLPAVKSRIHRARLALRTQLARYFEEEAADPRPAGARPTFFCASTDI